MFKMKSKFAAAIMAGVFMSAANPAYAYDCNQWEFFRKNGRVDGLDLQAMAAAAKRYKFDVRNCYGTELLRVEMTTSPVDLMGYIGTLKLDSRNFGENGTTTYTLGSKTFKTRTFGDRSEIQTNDGRWKQIEDMKEPAETIKDVRTIEELAMHLPEMRREVDEYIDPIAENMTLMMVGGLMSTLAVPYLSNYAPLAEPMGVTESVGGYSTSLWEIKAERAQAYAASRGLFVDMSGSHIRYWISPGGLIIKIDAKFGSGITEGPPMTYTYKTSRSAAPDPSWPK